MYVENRVVFLEAAMYVLATVRPVPCQRKKQLWRVYDD